MRHILITGGAGGLGWQTAQHFAAQGDTVYCCDLRTREGAHKNIRQLPLDLTDAASVQAMAAAVAAQTGHLDALIHLAGMYAMDSLVEIPEEELLRAFAVNFLGVYRVNKALLPLLRPKGRILIVTSELAWQKPLPFNGLYSLTKTTLDCYAHSLRLELALLDIPVIVFRPGAFQTNLLDAADASMRRLCERTQLYSVGAAKFRAIMDKETGGAQSPDKLARALFAAATCRRPKYIYKIHTSFRLRLYSLLPTRLQVWGIRRLLS